MWRKERGKFPKSGDNLSNRSWCIVLTVDSGKVISYSQLCITHLQSGGGCAQRERGEASPASSPSKRVVSAGRVNCHGNAVGGPGQKRSCVFPLQSVRCLSAHFTQIDATRQLSIFTHEQNFFSFFPRRKCTLLFVLISIKSFFLFFLFIWWTKGKQHISIAVILTTHVISENLI